MSSDIDLLDRADTAEAVGLTVRATSVELWVDTSEGEASVMMTPDELEAMARTMLAVARDQKEKGVGSAT